MAEYVRDTWPKLYACATKGCPQQGQEHYVGPVVVMPGLVGQRPDPVCLTCGLSLLIVSPEWGMP